MHKHKFKHVHANRASAQKDTQMEKQGFWSRVKGFIAKPFTKKATGSKGPSLWARMTAAAKKAGRKVVVAARKVYSNVVRPLVSLVRDFAVLSAAALWITALMVFPLETMFFTGVGIIALSLLALGIDWLSDCEDDGSKLATHCLHLIDAVVEVLWIAAQAAGAVLIFLTALASIEALLWTVVAAGIYITADQVAKRSGRNLKSVGDDIDAALSTAVAEGAYRPFVKAPTAFATPAA